ncbi:MAG: MBL fold metallo-hydrolase [Candidatus Heimdallarchaeota archaeon]|nr:MAG: MBL fold metallo-hydrolase [Candidatus Heimdallarchaeota archaeon]
MSQYLQGISDNIFLVQGRNNGRFPFSHSILIFNNHKEAILVDTGCGIEILQQIKSEYNLIRIINSHTHPDHSAGNWVFKDTADAILVPKEGFNSSGNIQALSYRFTEHNSEIAKFWRETIPKTMGMKECNPTQSFDSKSEFDFGDIKLLPIHTPGHTIDHYCFYEPNDQILLSFDIDLTKFGPWYGHIESDIPQFKDSITRLQDLAIKTLISSHKGIITNDIYKQLDVFYQRFDERTERIHTLLQEGVTSISQLVERKPIYGDFPYVEPLLRFWEEQMIRKHIAELEERGELLNIS